jgi:hypothetical protein
MHKLSGVTMLICFMVALIAVPAHSDSPIIIKKPPRVSDPANKPICPPSTTHAINCEKPPKVAKEDECKCNVHTVNVGGKMQLIRDCYYIEPETQKLDYCDAWRRVN